jgi:hypothetical protein
MPSFSLNAPKSSRNLLRKPLRLVKTKKSRDLSRLFFSAAVAAGDI